ncbi:MAG: hypothetical protein M0018_09285 [Nitrospiraceae bacterium]|nr:hypothetical protein [Nitrospiraceae bacterium]
MKRYVLFASLLAVPFLNAACHHFSYQPQTPVYSEHKYLGPLPAGLVIGKAPRIEKGAPPEEIKKSLSPLPPLLLQTGRPVYFFNGLYYYLWQQNWYFSRARTGPWYALPVKYYPKETRAVPAGINAPVMPVKSSIR